MNCKHHFLVETPNGPTSAGVCTKCQKVQYFRNGFEEVKRKRKAPQGKRIAVADISLTRKSATYLREGKYII